MREIVTDTTSNRCSFYTAIAVCYFAMRAITVRNLNLRLLTSNKELVIAKTRVLILMQLK